MVSDKKRKFELLAGVWASAFKFGNFSLSPHNGFERIFAHAPSTAQYSVSEIHLRHRQGIRTESLKHQRPNTVHDTVIIAARVSRFVASTARIRVRKQIYIYICHCHICTYVMYIHEHESHFMIPSMILR